jgi:hypothetical protein
MVPIVCSETSVTNNLRSFTSQKTENFIYTAVEAWNHTNVFTCLFYIDSLDYGVEI